MAWFVYRSPISLKEFQEESNYRKSAVVQNLKDIRTAQVAYKDKYRMYADNFNSLLNFVNNDSIALVKAIGETPLNDLSLVPIKFIYLTFPVGIILIILFVFTRVKNNLNYPLLAYCYPIVSLLLLLSMSTSYPHYYLFLLPSLSIIFSNYLTSNSFRYPFSGYTINFLLIFILLLISSVFLLAITNYKNILSFYYHGNPFFIYIPLSILLFSYFTSIIFLTNIKSNGFNILRVFYNIIIYQYLSLSLFFNFGVLGNPNYKTKLFLKDDAVSIITKTNTIYLFRVQAKIQTLLSFYLPSSKVIYDPVEIKKYKYIITSKATISDDFNIKQSFIPVIKFDNHVLIMNTSYSLR